MLARSLTLLLALLPGTMCFGIASPFGGPKEATKHAKTHVASDAEVETLTVDMYGIARGGLVVPTKRGPLASWRTKRQAKRKQAAVEAEAKRKQAAFVTAIAEAEAAIEFASVAAVEMEAAAEEEAVAVEAELVVETEEVAPEKVAVTEAAKPAPVEAPRGRLEILSKAEMGEIYPLAVPEEDTPAVQLLSAVEKVVAAEAVAATHQVFLVARCAVKIAGL